MTAWGGITVAATAQSAGLSPQQVAAIDRSIAEGTPYVAPNPTISAAAASAFFAVVGNPPQDAAALEKSRAVFAAFGAASQVPTTPPYDRIFGAPPIPDHTVFPPFAIGQPLAAAPVAWGASQVLPLRPHSALSNPDIYVQAITAALALAGFGPAAAGIALLYATGKLANAANSEITPVNMLRMPTLAEFDDAQGRPIYTWPDGTAHQIPPTWKGYCGAIISKPASL